MARRAREEASGPRPWLMTPKEVLARSRRHKELRHKSATLWPKAMGIIFFARLISNGHQRSGAVFVVVVVVIAKGRRRVLLSRQS